MGVSDQPGETKPQTAHRWTTQVMSHFVTVQDEAARSTSLSYVARATTLVCLGIQIFVRLFGNNMSQVSELLVSQFAESLLLVLIAVPTLLFAFFVWSCFVPSGKRLQRWTLESGLPHILLTVYVALHMINALLVLPVSLAIYARVLFWTVDSPGGYRQHIYQALMDKMSVAAMSLLYVMIVPTVISVFAALGYSSFGISLLRSGDFFSSSNRAIFLVLPGSLFITMVCNTLTFNMEAPFYSAGPGIFLNVFSLGLSLLGILIASYYTVFYHRGYRRIILQGNWMLFVSTLFDMIYSGMERRGSMRLALFMFAIFTFGSRLISNLDYFVQVIDPQSEYISLRMILCLEQAFYEYGLGNPALNTMMLKVKMYLVQNRDPTKVGPVSRSSSEIESSNQELIGSYLFNLFDKACWSSSKMNFMLGLHFANYLSSQKTNYLYLAILIRKMKDTDLSFSESFHIHRLETLITQSLKKKEIESSGSIHDQRRAEKTPSAQAQKTSLNLYKTVETINLYEQLMKSMRKQIDLVVSFYEHLEQPTTWIVKLHEIVEQINKGRVVCSELFDRVDEASSSMQAFHILPYALFLEQTENNFEKGTELVKYYDSKTNMMFKHLGRSIRESLLENSITLVVEAEKGRLGNIVFTSRNMRQAFGPEVPDIDGQSLDLFFNPDMAKVHQMELERFLGKLDKEYLGYRQQRYITFGNNIYYRVTVVTKFVPHIEDGFRLVLLIKNLSLDLADGNPGLMDTISFAVDDKHVIVGVCHHKDVFRSDGLLNPAVEALVGQPLEVVSPESREFLEEYFNVVKSRDSDNLREKRLSKKRLLLSVVGEKRYRKFFNNDDIFAENTFSTKQGRFMDKNSSKHTEVDPQNGEDNLVNDEQEIQMQQLEEEVQALKAGIQDHMFPQMGVKVSLQLVQLKKDDQMPEVVIVPAVARLESFRVDHTHDERSMSNHFVNEAALQFRDRSRERNRGIDNIMSTRRDLRGEIDLRQDTVVSPRKVQASLAILSLSLRDSTESTLPEGNKQKQYLGGVTLGLFRGDTTSVLQSEIPKANTLEERDGGQEDQQRDDEAEKSPPKDTFKSVEPKFITTTKESIDMMSPRTGGKPRVLPKLTLTTAPMPPTPTPKQVKVLPKVQLKVLTKFGLNRPAVAAAKPDQANAEKESLQKLYEQKYNDDKSMSQIPSGIESMPSDAALRVPQHSSSMQNRSFLKGTTTLVGMQAERTDEGPGQITGWQGLRTTYLPAITELRNLFGAGSSLVEEADQGNFGQGAPGENYIKSNSRSVVRSKQGLLLDNKSQKGGANKMAEVLDQGSMRSSNRTSHTGSRSHLVIRKMMMNPRINRLPQLVIGFLVLSMLILTHVFQEYLRLEFSDIFDEVNQLQYVFVTLVSMDCYLKGAMVNVLESQITFDKYQIREDRYQFLDSDLTDVRAESAHEFNLHMGKANKEQLNLLRGIADLKPENVMKFMNSDIQLQVRTPTKGLKADQIDSQASLVNTNPMEISLLILYNLHVWWEQREAYGDWASYNYYYYAIQQWFDAVQEVFSDFNTASIDSMEKMSATSIYLLVSFSLITQSLLGLLYFQARTIRRGMIGTMKNLENLRMFEILTKQDRLKYLRSMFDDTQDIEAHKRKIVSILRGMRGSRRGDGLDNSFHGLESVVAETKPHTVTKSNPTKSSQILPKANPQLAKSQVAGVVDPNNVGSVVTSSTDRRHVAGMYKMKREGKDTSYMIGNKLKIQPSQWMGLGVLLSALILIIEVQVGLNILTSERQRSSAVSYTNWMNVNQDYFLYVFYLNNLEAVIYIDSAGDMDLIELVPDLNDLAYEYFDTQKGLAQKVVKQLRALDTETRKFGFEKFFKDPCKSLDLTVYDLKFEDCEKFAGGVGASGYINFMEYTRILVDQVRDNFVNEAVQGTRIVNTTSFLTFAYFNKVVNRPMFEAIRAEMIDAADNVNDSSDFFVTLLGTTFQSILSVTVFVLFVLFVVYVDYATGLCYSIFLLLPEETYTINHYIRGFIKRLDS